MEGNAASEETILVDQAVTWLGARLPANWKVERSQRTIVSQSGGPPTQVDATIDLTGSNGVATLAVEARRSLNPRDVERLLPGLGRTIRALAGYISILVVAPWLSPRTQELLAAEGINFIDLTGNALIRLDTPALYIQTTGSTRNPSPSETGEARVRGPKAGRLIRLLADVSPPYGVRDIASAAGLAPGYVSRLLETLDRQALVERSRRGQVESVDYGGLVRRWAEWYDVLKSNDARTFLARLGAPALMAELAEATQGLQVAVTGSFAAVRLAPVAAPALVALYCEDPRTVSERLGLMPADEGANVVLLRPFDRVVWDRTSDEEGVRYVAPSQVAVDCLTGTGRMPAEGEAVLTWMSEHEDRWRWSSLSELDGMGGR